MDGRGQGYGHGQEYGHHGHSFPGWITSPDEHPRSGSSSSSIGFGHRHGPGCASGSGYGSGYGSNWVGPQPSSNWVGSTVLNPASQPQPEIHPAPSMDTTGRGQGVPPGLVQGLNSGGAAGAGGWGWGYDYDYEDYLRLEELNRVGGVGLLQGGRRTGNGGMWGGDGFGSSSMGGSGGLGMGIL